MRILFSSIWPINKTQSGVITPGQSGPERNGNKGVLRVTQSSSQSNCLVSYAGHSLGGERSYLSAEKQSVYSTASADWASSSSSSSSCSSSTRSTIFCLSEILESQIFNRKIYSSVFFFVCLFFVFLRKLGLIFCSKTFVNFFRCQDSDIYFKILIDV